MRRLLATAATAATAALLLSSCGTTEPAADSSNGSKKSGGSAEKAAGKSAGPVTVTGASGTEVKLDKPATKVVATEWNVVEHLVSLGVDPVGVADVKGYGTWDKVAPLTNKPKDIGTRGEPSIDTVAALQPDLIVATSDLPKAAVTQLKKIAPVLDLASADAEDPIGKMTENLDLIAKATGTTDQATALKKGFEAKLADGKKELAEAGHAGTDFAFSDAYVTGGQVSIRPFTSGSLIGAVNEQLGLKTPWTVKGDPAYGLGATDVEGLTKLPKDTEFAYIANDDDKSSTPYTNELADNAVWKSLGFVKAGNLHRLPDGVWMFGGTESMEAYVDAVVDSLTK